MFVGNLYIFFGERNVYLGLPPIFGLGCLFFWYWTAWAACKFWRLYTYCWGFTRLGWKQKEAVTLGNGKYVGRTWGQVPSSSTVKAEFYLHLYVNHLFCLLVFFQRVYQGKSSLFYRWHTQKHNNNISEKTMDMWVLLKFNTYAWWKSKFHNILY